MRLQRQDVERRQCQSPLRRARSGADGRLTAHSEHPAAIAVADAGVPKMRPLCLISAEERCCVGAQRMVESSIEGVHRGSEPFVAEREASSSHRLRRIVFAVHLTGRTMVTRLQQRLDTRFHHSVAHLRAIEGCVDVSIGREDRHIKVARQADCRPHALQIVGIHSRGVAAQVGVGTPQMGKCHQFPESKVAAHDEPLTHAQPIAARHRPLHASHFRCHHVGRHIVVAPSVAIGKERLPSVLRRHESGLQVRSSVEHVAQRVAIGVAQVSVFVAPPLVEGDASCQC